MRCQIEFFNGSWSHVLEFRSVKFLSLGKCVDYVYESKEFDYFFMSGYYLKSVTIL